jgi:hypothetical protein
MYQIIGIGLHSLPIRNERKRRSVDINIRMNTSSSDIEEIFVALEYVAATYPIGGNLSSSN